MKTYIVEVEYKLPVYKRVKVEARSVREACLKAFETDWPDLSQTADFDGSSVEYINGVWDDGTDDFVESQHKVPLDFRDDGVTP